MTKRKAEKQTGAAPMSAVAARKARQQAQNVTVAKKEPEVEAATEPPPKRPRRSLEGKGAQGEGAESCSPRTGPKKSDDPPPTAKTTAAKRSIKSNQPETQPSDSETDGDTQQDVSGAGPVGVPGEMSEDEVASVAGDPDGYESLADTPAELQNFPLSKARLNKNSIVYSDENTLCVRIEEKMNLALVGQYDLWVKRGVVSLMGAKLHPSPKIYRVYAPSTHSLPVIKCVSGMDGAAEVEIKSCKSGLSQLRDVSPLYQKIWNGQNTSADKLSLKTAPKDSRRSFSVLYTSSDDSLKRHLRPLHLDKKWSASMKALSQKQGRLRVLVCGPKASGKSTFSRFLLNHILSPAPETQNGLVNSDGVAFIDLDPGQPEFAPMGQVYLAHLQAPFFGPPFTHPSLNGSRNGRIVRAHHIGATSPKENPDHYALATMDLLDQYHSLLAQYPQCPLIVNYPGWIFGQGLEVATWLIKYLGLSDVVYMSEKGPSDVVEPLGFAAKEARVSLTILPSQPTDYVSRSSAQLRSMQVQSYFHMSHVENIDNPLWQGAPLSRTRPITVDYAGPKKGIAGIMVMGSQIHPDMLREVLEGSIVGVVAVESSNSNMGDTSMDPPYNGDEDHAASEDMDLDSGRVKPNDLTSSSLTDNVIRTSQEDLPYLLTGSGTSTPLDPKSSNCLGLALIRSVDVKSHKIELSTPIAPSNLRDAFQQEHQLVLVRGQLDNPNWAVSEEYHAARAAERQYQESIADRKNPGSSSEAKEEVDPALHRRTLAHLRERVRRASQVPWMTVVEDNSRRQREAAARREKSLWKLKKKAYMESESDLEL